MKSGFRIGLWLALLGAGNISVCAQVVISELVADNKSTLRFR